MIWPLSCDNRPFGAAVKPNCRATIREMTRDKTKMSRDIKFAKRNVSAVLLRNRGKMSRDIREIVAWQSDKLSRDNQRNVAQQSEKLSRDNQGPSSSETQPPCSFLYRHDTVINKLSTLTHVVVHRLPLCIPDHTGHDGTSLNRYRAAELLSQKSLAVFAFHCSYARHSKIKHNNHQKRVFSERQCVHFLLRWWPTLAQLVFFFSFSFSQTCALNSNMSQDTFKNEPDPRGYPSKWHPFCGPPSEVIFML